MIEVVVSALLVALIASAAAVGLISTGHLSADQRSRSQAESLAQQDQDRLRGMSTKQLANLTQTRTVTLGGTPFTVTSTGRYLSSGSNASACTSSGASTADYLRIVSSVNWPANRRPPVTADSIVSPPTGGSLLAQVQDPAGAPVSGATVLVTGPDTESAITDADGCTIFGSLATGDYTVTISKTGYIDINGNSSVTGTATVTNSGTAYPTGNPVKLAQPGGITVTDLPSGNPTSTFRTQFASGTVLNDQLAPSLSWYGSGSAGAMSSFASTTPSAPAVAISSPGTLFPFSNSNAYTNNYVVWAGACESNEPPTTNLSWATVAPGATATPIVTEPAMDVRVTYKGTRVKPDHIKLTYLGSEPSPGCTYSYYVPVAADAASLTGRGSLASPGQPFATSGNPAGASGKTGAWTVCADYDPPDAVTARKVSLANVRNSNFAAATVATVAITDKSTSGLC